MKYVQYDDGSEKFYDLLEDRLNSIIERMTRQTTEGSPGRWLVAAIAGENI
jgi:hypothetical protein